MQRYVIEYVDADGNACAAYIDDKKNAELFWGTLHGKGLTFYREEIVIDKPDYMVFRRVETYHP